MSEQTKNGKTIAATTRVTLRLREFLSIIVATTAIIATQLHTNLQVRLISQRLGSVEERMDKVIGGLEGVTGSLAQMIRFEGRLQSVEDRLDRLED